MDTVAVALSVFSTIVALISVYISQFKKGKVLIPPIRAYRREPLSAPDGARSVRIYITLTFMNTGALHHAISSMRMRIPVPEKKQDLILDWENECPSLECDYRDSKFATQPTLGPYESLNRIYTFRSKFEAGELTSAIEKACEQDENKTYRAWIEMIDARNKWRPLCKMEFHHSGRMGMEANFNKINGLK